MPLWMYNERWRNREAILRIEVKHNLGRERAIEKIDRFFDKLPDLKHPAGISIVDASRSWQDNVMNISFKAKKGFIRLNVTGEATVDEDVVIIEINLPPIVASFISEDQIRSTFLEKVEAFLIEV